MMEGGATLLLDSRGTVRGPGHNAVLSDGKKDWLVHHFYDAWANGARTLQIRPLTWSEDGWPIAGEPYAGASPASDAATSSSVAGSATTGGKKDEK